MRMRCFFSPYLRRRGFCRPRDGVQVLILGGSAGVTTKMLPKNPGDTFTLTAIYNDPKGKNVPLASLPVATEPTLGTLTPVGTPTLGDAQFEFTGTVPANAAAGTQYSVLISAEGDPSPGVNTINGNFIIGVVADEDTTVAITGA